MNWLVFASLFFYGWWNPVYVSLILCSMVFNYSTGVVLSKNHDSQKNKKYLLIFGIGANLALLAYYKYSNFMVENINHALHAAIHLEPIILPLGISFFTFTQIAYLVDAYRGLAREYNISHYALFVTYFPHLIAGPVLHHKEMMPQFSDKSIYKFNFTNFNAGFSYFILGLFKKSVIADGMSVFAAPIFDSATKGLALTTLDGWCGALAYSFQLYFDFSGYSDMAIGLALMMGIRLPVNFDSPYKAINIIDFWRRWHMTLSRFLRDYIYIALGGNRHGDIQRYWNLILTMLIGGLWHGSGWTFIIWGGLHGVLLIINHGWQSFQHSYLKLSRERNSSWLSIVLARGLTFIAVVIGWVIFRATDMAVAKAMLSAMFLNQNMSLSPFVSELVQNSLIYKALSLFNQQVSILMLLCSIFLAISTLTFCAPNTQQIMSRYFVPPNKIGVAPPRLKWLQWRPTPVWAVSIGLLSVWSLLGLSSVSEFLYFQF